MIPEKFKRGDTIGLIAPSSPVLKEDLETINNSIMLMESAGFKIKFAPNAISNKLGYSATAKQKSRRYKLYVSEQRNKGYILHIRRI